jgi:hypothetical protein
VIESEDWFLLALTELTIFIIDVPESELFTSSLPAVFGIKIYLLFLNLNAESDWKELEY